MRGDFPKEYYFLRGGFPEKYYFMPGNFPVKKTQYHRPLRGLASCGKEDL